jgi:methyltransferase (TIGR00027 family)
MKYTERLRASIVALASYIEDMAKEQIGKGVKQNVLLGAGLDSFTQRNTEISSQVHIYENNQPNTLQLKEDKLIQNGYEIPYNLHFVTVDFETSSWWNELLNKGFDPNQKTFV